MRFAAPGQRPHQRLDARRLARTTRSQDHDAVPHQLGLGGPIQPKVVDDHSVYKKISFDPQPVCHRFTSLDHGTGFIPLLRVVFHISFLLFTSLVYHDFEFVKALRV